MALTVCRAFCNRNDVSFFISHYYYNKNVHPVIYFVSCHNRSSLLLYICMYTVLYSVIHTYENKMREEGKWMMWKKKKRIVTELQLIIRTRNIFSFFFFVPFLLHFFFWYIAVHRLSFFYHEPVSFNTLRISTDTIRLRFIRNKSKREIENFALRIRQYARRGQHFAKIGLKPS